METFNCQIYTGDEVVTPSHHTRLIEQIGQQLTRPALVLAQLAPGRFRLGLGTSHRGGMEQTFGVDFEKPLAHLREYIQIAKADLAYSTFTRISQISNTGNNYAREVLGHLIPSPNMARSPYHGIHNAYM